MGKLSKEEKKLLKQQQKDAKAAAKRAKKRGVGGTAWTDIPSTSVVQNNVCRRFAPAFRVCYSNAAGITKSLPTLDPRACSLSE